MMRTNPLPASAIRQIERACERFELAWKAGEVFPRIEDCLGEVPGGAAGSGLLAELLAIEVEYLRQRGQPPSPADYCLRFPEYASAIHDRLEPAAPNQATATQDYATKVEATEKASFAGGSPARAQRVLSGSKDSGRASPTIRAGSTGIRFEASLARAPSGRSTWAMTTT